MDTTVADDAEPHAWDRTFLPWDVYFALAWVATVVFALSAETPGRPVRLAAVALFTLLVPWYVLAGRPVILGPYPGGRRAVRYLAVLIGVFTAAASLVGELRLGAFALMPQCFMMLPLGAALPAAAVINVAPVVGWALLWRPAGHVLFYNSVFAAVTLAFSMVIGSWIVRIIEQSAERADMLAELRAGREEIARLSAERGALAERERLSREIHDTLAQGFTSLLMLVQAVESEVGRDPAAARRHLELMARTARENLAEARALVAGGAPAGLAGTSLPDAVRRLAARHAEQSGAAAEVEVTGPVRALPAAVEVVALRTCQEALANARRHAGPAAPVRLHLAYADEELTMTVRDEGRGFDTTAASGGYGLRGLRARADELGGAARVAASPGAGTTVSVTLPVGRTR